MLDAPPIQLSQNHLKLLSLCGRKFQHTYLDQLGILATGASQPQQQQGKLFHQLMQQFWMGLEIQPILDQSEELRSRFRAFQAYPPALIEGQQLTEHRCQTHHGQFVLVGVFDLLILGETQAQIVDWKSFQKPKSPARLQQDWQTKLYPYLLSQSSQYQPEQISMTYWFAQAPSTDPVYHFPYTSQTLRETETELTRLLTQLEHALLDFQRGHPLPQTEQLQRCQEGEYTCPFLDHCQRRDPHQSSERQLGETTFPKPLTDITVIPEHPLALS